MKKIKTSQLLKTLVFLLVLFAVISARNLILEKRQAISESPARDIRAYCAENAAKMKGIENCYAEEFKKFAEQNGPEKSFELLNNLQKIDPETIGCHLIAHGIGWGSYKRDPDNWRGMVRTLPTICSYGAIHGVIESYVSSLPEKSLSREVIPTVCGEQPRADCNHIVGHLLLVQTDAEVKNALDLCTVFGEKRQRDFCISGVFMEYQTALNLVEHDLAPESWLNWPPRLPELEKMCRAETGENAEGCWEEIVHVGLAAFQNDPKKIFELCASAQVPEGAKKCRRHSIGIIGASKNFDLPSLKYVCTLERERDPNFESECYPITVSSALSTIPTKVPEAVLFCNSLQNEFKRGCFAMIGGVGSSISTVKEMLPSSCEKAPSEFKNDCLGLSGGQNYIRSTD